MNSLGVERPKLVKMIMAWVEDNWLLVLILDLPNIETESGMVLQGSLLSWPERNLLVWIIVPWSYNNHSSWSVLPSSSVGESVLSSDEASD